MKRRPSEAEIQEWIEALANAITLVGIGIVLGVLLS